jgi:hypothetical protein
MFLIFQLSSHLRKGTVFETRLQKNELHEISEATSLEQFKILMDWANKTATNIMRSQILRVRE